MVSKPDSLLTWVSNEVLSAIDFDVRIGNLTLEAQRGTGKQWKTPAVGCVFFLGGRSSSVPTKSVIGPVFMQGSNATMRHVLNALVATGDVLYRDDSLLIGTFSSFAS